jgi:hypothetical protein
MSTRAIAAAFITFMEDMKPKKSLLFTLTLVILAAIIHVFSTYTDVEGWYSDGIYPPLGRFLRLLLGWLPFSTGDIIYGVVVLWLITKLAKGIKALYKKRVTRQSFLDGLQRTLNILLVTYILFNALWGINYNRHGIARQLELKLDKYSVEELKNLNALLVEKVNESKQALVDQKVKYPSNRGLFSKVDKAYADAEKVYPFLKYKPVSLKPSMWSWLGNYIGFTGYYNPFTGEAQVNTLVPKFLQPFTTCHEVAHQLGYAKEMEANFVGYLAAINSNDTLLHYSVYLDLLMYSSRDLYMYDSAASKESIRQLIPEVKEDLREWREYIKKGANLFEPVFRSIYSIYLRRNQQPQGLLSYDKVTGFMIAYYKKYHKI